MGKSIPIKLVSDYIPEVREMLGTRMAEPELSILSMPKLNNKIWGIKRKKMTLIGARTSQGKSSMALHIGWDLAKQGHEVLFLSLEMCAEDLIERLFCNEYKIDNEHLLKGRFLEFKDKFLEFEKMVETVPFGISDCLGKDWADIDKQVSSMSTKPKVIIVDYVQAIKGQGTMQKGAIDDYIIHFREMAVKHNFAGIICSQINRTSQETENKEPQLHQLKGTGVLEEHSDVVILLHWEHKYKETADPNKYKLIVEKNRNGRTGWIEIKFFPQYYRYEDYEEGFVDKYISALTKKDGWE